MKTIITLILLSIILSNCSSSIEETVYECENVPVSNIWGKWKEIAFQGKIQDFDSTWTVSTKKDLFYINSCSDISIEQRKTGVGCCGFLYYKLSGNTLTAGGLGGGKGCENVYCAIPNYKLTIEKMEGDSLTLINDLGRSKYIKVK